MIRNLLLSAFLLTLVSSCQTAGGGIQNLGAQEFDQLLKQKSAPQLLDVRTPQEYQTGHIPTALNFDINSPNFEQRIARLDKNRPVFVYCLSGGRSASAATILKSAGFKEIYNLEGGMLKWNAAGKPKEMNNAPTGSSEERPQRAPGMSGADFQKMVTSDKYVLVDFNAVWCGPCKRLAPMLDAVAEQKKDKLVLQKVDVDANQQLTVDKGIDRIPYLELYQNGKLVWKHQGLIDQETFLRETKL